MRRMAPPPRLRVDPSSAPARCRVGLGPTGLRLEAAVGDPMPASPWSQVAMTVAGPLPCTGLDAAQDGTLLVGWGPGLVRTVRAHDIAGLFDRRPPGIDRAVGASTANAALVHADDGWRAVVLPSLGDRIARLGDGPVAIAPDGLTVAVSTVAGITVTSLADGEPQAEHGGGPVDALALGAEGAVWAARGAAIGDADVAHADGPPVTLLRLAAGADVAVGLHDDGRVTVVTAGAHGHWPSPIPADQVSVSHDGLWVLLAGPDGVVVCDAASGASALSVEGARCGAFTVDGQIAVGGEWGLAMVTPVENAADAVMYDTK